MCYCCCLVLCYYDKITLKNFWNDLSNKPMIPVKELLHDKFECSEVLLICFNIIKDNELPKLSEELTAREQTVLLWVRWGTCVYVIWLQNKNEKLWWVQSQHRSNTFSSLVCMRLSISTGLYPKLDLWNANKLQLQPDSGTAQTSTNGQGVA